MHKDHFTVILYLDSSDTFLQKSVKVVHSDYYYLKHLKIQLM